MLQPRHVLRMCISLVVIASGFVAANDIPTNPGPPKVPAYFQAEIQITGTHSHSTYYGEIFYDSDKNQGMVVVENATLKMQVLHNFDGINNQTILIQDKRTQGGLNEVPLSCAFYDDSIRFNPCSETLLLLAFDAQQQFSAGYLLGITPNLVFRNDKTEELGIESYLFTDDNVTLPAMKNNPVKVETNWYSGNSEWNFPNCPQSPGASCETWQVPLKTTVSTMATCSKDETALPISVQYVYFNYRVSKPDPTVFQIPQGLYCPNIKSTRFLPNLEDGFTTGIEATVSAEVNGVISSTLYYDGKGKMERIDASFSPKEIDNNAPAEALIVEIIDYNAGVQYSFDPIKNECLDLQNLSESQAHQNLQDVYAVIADENFDQTTALYVGKRDIRGIACDVWTLPLEHDDILEIYLNEINYKLQDGVPVSRWSAVSVNKSFVAGDADMSQTRTFYNFEDVVPKRSVFEYISTCIPEEFKKRFQIEIRGSHANVQKNPENFIKTVTDEIAKETNISVFRIQDVMLDYLKLGSDEFVLFTATMLEDIYIAGGLGTNEDNIAAIVTNDEAYDGLADNVYKNNFQVNFNVESLDILYSGVSIRDDIVSTNPQIDTEVLKDAYSQVGNLDLKDSGFDYQLVDQSLTGCAVACLESEAVLCESFAYCTNMGSCKISRRHYENMTKDDTIVNGRCQLYSRNYLLDFKASRYVKVKPTEDEAAVPIKIATPEQCARQCSQNPGHFIPFFCEGFDLCLKNDKTTTCEFRSRHVLEIPNEDFVREKTCSHFSRDYVDDFVVHTDYSAEGASKELATAVSAQECARLCVQQSDDQACKAFEMCRATKNGRKTKCKLLEFGRTDPGTTLKRDANCDYYSRERFGPPKRGHHVAPTKPSLGKRYLLGEMIGLGIGMVIGGFLLGAGIMVLLMRFRLCCFGAANDQRRLE